MEPDYTPQQQPTQQEAQPSASPNPLPQAMQPQVSGDGSMKKSYSLGKKRLGVLVGGFVTFGVIAGVALLVFSRAGTTINSQITLDKATWQVPANPATDRLVGLRANVQIKKLNTDASSNYFYAAQTNTICPAGSDCPELTVGIRTSTEFTPTEKRSVATFTIKQVANLQSFSSSTTTDKPAYKTEANSRVFLGENAVTIAVPIDLAEGATYKLGIDDDASDNRLYWTAWVEASGNRTTIGRFYPVTTQSPSDIFSLNGTSTLHSRLYGPTDSCDKITASSVTFSNILMVRIVDRSAVYATGNTHTTDQTCPNNNKVETTASSYTSSVAPVSPAAAGGNSTAPTNNPVGYVDFCSKGSGTTILYGWAYDPDGGATDGTPSVNLKIGSQEFNAIPTDLDGYRTADIDAFLSRNGYSVDNSKKYGFKKELTGISKDSVINGTITNIGSGTSVPIGINTKTDSILNATDGPTRYLFADGKIPSECASAATATQTTAQTPSGTFTGGSSKVDGYIDYCTRENNKTVLYGWAYDSANGYDGDTPKVRLQVGSNNYEAPTDQPNYRTDEINNYLNVNSINGTRGTANTSKYGFRKEVSGSGVVSGRILSTAPIQDADIKVNTKDDFGAGKFKFGANGTLPGDCLPDSPIGYIDYCLKENNKTVLIGWAYDPNTTTDVSPAVEIMIGASKISGINSERSYRTDDIDKYIDSIGLPGSRGGRYGFRAEVTAPKDASISGTIINVGLGSNTSLLPNSWRDFDAGTFKFVDNKIPEGCASAAAAAPTTPSTSTPGSPVGYIDYCALENNKTVLYGWAYDPNGGATDSTPTVNIKVGSTDFNGVPTDQNYRTADINSFLTNTSIGGIQGTESTARYGFRKEVSGSGAISGTINNTGTGANAGLPSNTWRDFGAGKFKFGAGGTLPSDCLPTTGSSGSTQTLGSPVGYIDYCKPNGGKVLLYGWAYDPDAADDASPTVEIKIGTSTKSGITTGTSYRTQDIDSFLDGNGYAGKPRGNRMYGFVAEVTASSGDAISGTITNVGPGNSASLTPNAWKNFDTGTFIFEGNKIPAGCMNTPAPAPSSTNNNPVGYIDYCKPAANGQFTIYGWAYDPDSTADTAPLVNITVAGNQYTQILTDKSYRTADIDQFLDQSGYLGKPRGNRLYGFSRIMSGSAGSQISGIVLNEGGGSNAALPANDWKEFGSGTFKFEGGKIPSGCAPASSSTSSTGIPVGYLDSCIKNGSTTTLKGWAYDPDGAPALLINVGSLPAGATANASGYRTDAVNAFLDSVYPGKTRYNAYGFTVSFSGLSKSTTYDVRGTIIDTGKGNEFQPLGINYVNTESSVLLGGSAITDGQLPDACLN